ncbi:MAG: M42 family metallopeptidase [Anaerolineae bacterium]|nr:M42 family metallopeptidase [Caldilineales bacterium]MDW8267645.1 M42 family metallopeptidase [Anaerolineae bacterium]
MNLLFDYDYLQDRLLALLALPSPTGRAEPVLSHLETALRELGLEPQRTSKGVLTAAWPGEEDGIRRGLAAHVDTLGAMVKRIRPNGRLVLARLGGFDWSSVEGEGCQVFTQSGEAIRGSVLPVRASKHIYGPASEGEKGDEAMEVRLDERVSTAWDVRDLGIEVGDFVAFDPRPEVSPAGFVRSRYLDNKACVACLLAAIRAVQRAGLRPRQGVWLHFGEYEEVGHGGASGFPAGLEELVVLDIGPVGEGQNADEYRVVLCAKDSNGPYHPALTGRLRHLALSEGIPFCVDIYPFYGSDGGAYWHAGGDARIALIGPGVDATHHYERTHREALLATTRLIAAYVLS